MEQHPVPQDITGFEFKLVGDMTLKQFGYLAGGAIVAVLVFFSGLPVFVKWPLIAIFAFLGVAFAFMPIEERPLDKWVVNFIKSIYSPTLFSWKKKKARLDFMELRPLKAKFEPEKKLKVLTAEERKTERFLTSLPKEDVSVPGKKEKEFLENLDFSYGGEAKKIVMEKRQVKLPFQQGAKMPARGEIVLPKKEKEEKEGEERLRKPVVLKEAGKEGGVDNKIAALEKEIEVLKEKSGKDADSLWRLKELGLELQKAEAEKERLERELITLKKEKEEEKGERDEKEKAVKAKYVKDKKAQKTGLPIIPRGANIIGGIVKDKKRQELEGVVIVVKDKNDNPVRALKTNKVGQFMIATPLSNGKYTMELEKEGYDFDIIEIELTGQVVPAIEVVAK